MPAVLRAGSITLRSLKDRDVDLLEATLARPGVREWWGPLDDPQHTREGLVNNGAAFAIEVDGMLAGWLGYNEEADPDCRHASLDIFLAPEQQQQGFGPTALRLAAQWLFDERGHHRLTIDPACHNEHAIRAYTAVGFRPVGVMRCYERGANGRWHDNLLMDLLREDPHPSDRNPAATVAPRRRQCIGGKAGLPPLHAAGETRLTVSTSGTGARRSIAPLSETKVAQRVLRWLSGGRNARYSSVRSRRAPASRRKPTRRSR